jgi:hypothetical protein
LTLNPGTRFGSYEIVALFGGGMGEVYREADTLAADRDREIVSRRR